jgi:glycosyltransferase involved in cell wall biosynthesis
VPSYNQSRFLERTILSILNQNYPNTDLIIIDGGSQDGSAELIQKYEPYISYWASEPDKGQANAINKGFERASGDLVGWQNSDDLYLPGFFHTAAESFLAHPKAQLFYGNIYMIDENDEVTWGSKYVPFSVSHLIYLDWNLSSQATFLRRELVEEAGPLREDIQVGFDWDWFITVGRLVKCSVLHNTYGGCYRIHSTSKFSEYSHDSRLSIEVQILRRHGVRVREALPYRQQMRWRARPLKLRMMVYSGLLYNSKTRNLRPLIVRFLEKRGIICKGFE